MKSVTNNVSAANSCNACLVMVRHNKTAENTNTMTIRKYDCRVVYTCVGTTTPSHLSF